MKSIFLPPVCFVLALSLGAPCFGALQAKNEAPPPSANCPANAQHVPLGADIAAIAQAAPNGTSFCLAAGEYRLQVIAPKDSQSFYGEPGALLNGSRRVAVFRKKAGYWVAGGQSQRGHARPDVPCVAAMPRCIYPDAVFLDDEPLLQAGSLPLLTQGHFFFDYGASEIYLADDPTGRKVEASVAPYAFASRARKVTIKGLIVEKYAPPAQAGAIGSNLAPAEWTVDDNEIRLNASIGVVVGAQSHVTRNRIHDNGQMGAGCAGNDILFERNDISRNGYFSGVDPLWEGGGAKCAKTSGLLVRLNHVTRNNGIGFWTDIDNIATHYESNVFERNVNSGISHEISYAATIRDNVFRGNGDGFHVWLWGGAIQIQNSRDVEVLGNVIYVGRGNGIVLIQQNRETGAYGPHTTINNSIHDNLVVYTLSDYGASGTIADHDAAALRAGNNRFARNTYQVPDLGKDRWAWVDGFYSWDGYRARSAQDSDSALSPYRIDETGENPSLRRSRSASGQ